MRVAATVIAVLVGIIVMTGLYAKCGPLCWQGLLQAQKERY
jgi:hypothetical protein